MWRIWVLNSTSKAMNGKCEATKIFLCCGQVCMQAKNSKSRTKTISICIIAVCMNWLCIGFPVRDVQQHYTDNNTVTTQTIYSTYIVTLRRFRLIAVVVGKQLVFYYVFQVCVCQLGYLSLQRACAVLSDATVFFHTASRTAQFFARIDTTQNVCFDFLYKFFFFILRKTLCDLIKAVHLTLCKVSVIHVRF